MIEEAYLAAGCFWGTEYYFMQLPRIATQVGYMGGLTFAPTYREVCTGDTGHIETVEIVYDNEQVEYETLVKLFFETHNFSQIDGQGPDIGSQYVSVIFYTNEKQRDIATYYITLLQTKGYFVATQLRQAEEFWVAEDYHQTYYTKTGGTPYCHKYTKIF